ncbi:MAG TPA: DUF1992 domain-containing protein [Chthonomonadaceae bacterium]|nr:DUF1992 domain-containing protein [Chthonomonadaceae bacterium]
MDLDIMGQVAERKIQEAIEEGQFDNLPGKGQPIVFTDDPMTPPHLRLANRILKNAGVLPEWMQLQKEIEEERKAVTAQRGRLAREYPVRKNRVAALPSDHVAVRQFAEWHVKSRAAYHRRLKEVNTMILKFTMMVPTSATPFIPYKMAEEMAAFDAEFPPLEHQPEVALPEEPKERAGVRSLAYAAYLRKQRD